MNIGHLIPAILLGLSCQTQDLPSASQHFQMQELAEGVYVAIHKIGGKAICNVGIVNLGEETLIFDTFLSPKVMTELLDILDEYGLPPLKYVVNSHYHNDHIRGNQVFDVGTKIISSRQTAELIQRMEPQNLLMERKTAPAKLAHYDSLRSHFDGDTTEVAYRDIMMWRPYYEVLAQENAHIKTRLPNVLIDTTMVIRGTSRTARLVPTERGHSEGDLYLFLDEDRIIFAGDLLFKQTHPFLGAGDLSAWQRILQQIKDLKPEKLLPGHGPIASLDDIDALVSYIDWMREASKTYDPQTTVTIPPPYQSWDLSNFYELNLQILSTRD